MMLDRNHGAAVHGRRTGWRTAGALLGACLLAAGLPARAPATAPSPPRFFDVTAQSGVTWKHNNGAFGKRWLPETLGPGVVIFDANGDGLPDLLFVNGSNFPGEPGRPGTPALYLNQGGMRFKDVTHEWGLDINAYCLGGAAADIDNDGRPDLYLSCLGQDHLLHNEGNRFVDITRRAGLSQSYELGASVAFFDADRDGFLDIYVTRYTQWTPQTDLFCSADGQTKSYCTPADYQGTSGHYYHNRGDGTFEDWTRKAGLYSAAGKQLGVVPLDFDGDGWPDLAVAVDTSPNLLFHNRGDGTFEEVGMLSGVALSLDGNTRGGMGIDAGDYNHTGRPSLLITFYALEMTSLYRNEGRSFFLDLGAGSEIGRKTAERVGWGCFFFDYDLDGWLDVLIVNGHLDPDLPKALGARLTYAQAPQLFHNLGTGEFADVTASAGGDLARPLVARGAAFADLDGDGDLDLVLTTNGGPARIFENRGRHGNWLRLALEGTRSNRDGLGATVKVRSGGMWQSWYVHSGGSYLSQSQVEPTFGLGTATAADEVVIQWPSGSVQRLTGVAANQRLKVREPAGGRYGRRPGAPARGQGKPARAAGG
jgi:hypothetical protein